MLAAERRGELGIARAIGTRRGQLVKMYVFEGVAYDLTAAVVGVMLGIGVAYGMVVVMAAALDSLGLEIGYAVSARSVVIAYALGVLLTLAVVTVSAWRVSVVNIASAVRNLPERQAEAASALGTADPRRRRGDRWRRLASRRRRGCRFLLGVSLGILGFATIARGLELNARAVYTTSGLAIVVLWLLRGASSTGSRHSRGVWTPSSSAA